MTVPAKPTITFAPLQDPLGFKLLMTPTLLARFDAKTRQAIGNLRNIGTVTRKRDHIEVRLRNDRRIQQRNALLAEVHKAKHVLKSTYGDNVEIDTSGMPEPHRRPPRTYDSQRRDPRLAHRLGSL
jgi:hypothetical protein